MNTPLLQATNSKAPSSRPQEANIHEARPSGYSDEAKISFQLPEQEAKPIALEVSDSLEEQLVSSETLVFTQMAPVSTMNTHSGTTPNNPQLFIAGELSPVDPAGDAKSLTGTSLSEDQAAMAALLKLSENKSNKALNMPASSAFYTSSSVSTYGAERGLQQTAILNSASETNSSSQLTMSSNEPISPLSRNLISKELLPNAIAIQSHAPSAPPHTQTALHFGAPYQVHSAEWASIKVDTSAAKWGEQMMQVLHDRVTLQAQQSMQEAKIRLDPPELGKLNLIVRVEGDTLNVQINANAASTREALVQVSERLRAELQNQNFVNVNVNVGSDDSSQQQTAQQELDHFTIFSARDTSKPDSLSNLSEHWLSTQA
ncbi:flagellar hook-length control protein FliK [Vibrio sp. YIC-376]|uniref:flagellar hook-length control protein FliK n=1 Tax=Vibrio sp. YIC-376 TaxID=3136162 RepID=UPI00402AEA44